MTGIIYKDREDAGRRLAEALRPETKGEDSVVLGLARGGVPVAYEIARTYNAPLDVFLVRKVGVPGHEELAAGAVASGGVEVVNEEVVQRAGLSRQDIAKLVEEQRDEIERHAQRYRGESDPVDVEGKTAILVDDGVATGASMEASVRALRLRNPKKIIVAVPVASPAARGRIEAVADAFVCPEEPRDFMAVGGVYSRFDQVNEGEVGERLALARGHAS